MELPALFNERDVAPGALRIAQAAVGQAQDLVIAANGPGQLQGLVELRDGRGRLIRSAAARPAGRPMQ